MADVLQKCRRCGLVITEDGWDGIHPTCAKAELGENGVDVEMDESGRLVERASFNVSNEDLSLLLAALEGLLSCRCGPEVKPGECCQHVTAARAAIAKATQEKG